MASTSSFSLMIIVTTTIVMVLCAQRQQVAASPTIAAAAPSLKPQEIIGKLNEQQQIHSDNNNSTLTPTPQDGITMASGSLGQQKQQQPQQHLLQNGLKQASRAATAEKLKRGLSNFMNHLNAATYFVPPPAAVAGLPNGKTATTSGSQTESATIIRDGPSADVLIKGPTRLVHARPLGGPLRWGRR